MVALIGLGGDLGLVERSRSRVALVLGAVLIYCFWLVIATCAFWVVRM